VRVVCC